MKRIVQFLISFLLVTSLYAQPSTITYQGVLTNDSGELITGTPAVTFTLYDALTDGNSLWTETHNSVQITNGLFQVELGSETPFGSLSFAQEMWLQITVGATTLSPRVKFNASGYSLAGKATSLQITTGASEGKVLTSDASGNASWATPQWTTSGSDIYYNTGNVGIGTASPGHKFTVNGAGTGNTAVLGIDVTGTGSFNWASSSIAPNLAEGNNIIHMIGQSESLKNSGYIGFNYSGNSSNSNFLTFGLHSLDNIMNITGSGYVGIGTTAPAAQLHTTGTVRFAGAGTPGDGKVLTSDASGNATWQAASGGSGSGITVSNVATDGDLVYYSSGNWVAKRLVCGNTGSGTAVGHMQPYLTVNYCIAVDGLFPTSSSEYSYIGQIEIFAFNSSNFIPSEYLVCNGALYPIMDYQALYALIGITYGGSGGITFNVPDLRGRTPIGFGQGSGLTNRIIGSRGGSESFTISVSNLPSHSHTITYED